MPGPIDLHAHSSVSDGTDTPEELIEAAVAAGLGVIAITDHDSTAGWSEAFRTAVGTGLTVLPGMEFSTRWDDKSVHLLAYLIDPEDPAIVEEMASIRDSRYGRAERIVERIRRDYALDWSDVLDQASEGATIGRPHIADALVARGHVRDRGEAFGNILSSRSPYYEAHHAPTPLEAVRMVVAAGGVPVLAHPATHDRAVLPDSEMAGLVAAGLAGLELEHRENTEAGKRALRRIAEKYDLLLTGSSDYHGEGKPNRLGENTTSPEVYEKIVALGRGSAPFEG